MVQVLNFRYRQALSKLRCSSHSLESETGRHNNTPRTSRICKKCTMNVLENEYHLILVCPFYRELSNTILTQYY